MQERGGGKRGKRGRVAFEKRDECGTFLDSSDMKLLVT